MMRTDDQGGDGNGLTVTRLARAAGVPATTVRFYERAGLIAPLRRARGAYRRFGPDAAARLRFIKAAQALGLTLKDTRALLDLDAASGRGDVRVLLEKRLGEVEARLTELKQFRGALAGALARCRRSGRCCDVLVSLGVGAGETKGSPDDPEQKEHGDGQRGDGRGGGGGRVRLKPGR